MQVDSTAASITGWTMVGGAPLTPACMVTSTLKHYANAYSEFMIMGLSFHYITTSATSQQGSVMFYINKDRIGPGLNTSSANFMPMVLSDHNTIIAPLWKNSTCSFIPEPDWLTTVQGLSDDLRHQAPGELYAYTKTSAIDSPGYVLIDYDICFRNMQNNPRSLTLPVARMKYTQVRFTMATARTAGDQFYFNNVTTGTLLDGVTNSALPSGTSGGDIFKCVLDISNSSITVPTMATIFKQAIVIDADAITPVDGFTCYAMYDDVSGRFWVYPTYAAAISNGNPYEAASTATYNGYMYAYISLVASTSNAFLQSNF
jgi:hypothetical protein